MILFAVERSTANAGVALFKNGACIGEKIMVGEPARMPAWMQDVRDLLAECNIQVSEIQGLVTGLGPGSFSGIRAAIAGLQGLGLPNGITLKGVSSAAALAWRTLQNAPLGTTLAVLGDARRNQYWCGVFQRDKQYGMVVVADENRRPLTHTSDDFHLVPWSALAAIIPDNTVVLTPEWERLEKPLLQLGNKIRLVQGNQQPGVGDVAELALCNWNGARSEPSPIYLHPPVSVAPSR